MEIPEIATSTGCPQQRPDNFSFSKPATESIAWSQAKAWRHNWEDRSLQLEYVYYVYIIYNYNVSRMYMWYKPVYIYIIAYYSIYTYMVWRYLKKCMPRNVNRSLTNIMQWHQTTRSHPISSTWRCSSSPMRNDQRLIQSNPYSQPLS